MKRLECLDGLRGVLAVYVMLGHMAPFAALPAWIVSPLAHGGAAVDVFFILSGLVIFRSLESCRFQARPFLILRTTRIFPVFLAMLAAAIVLQPLPPPFAAMPWIAPDGLAHDILPQGWPANWAVEIAAHLTMTHGLFPNALLPDAWNSFLAAAWSLSTEWQFYVLALLLGRTRMSVERLVTAFLLLAVAGLAWDMSAPEAWRFSRAFLPNKAQYFALGIASAAWTARRSLRSYVVVLGATLLLSAAHGNVGKLVPPLIWTLCLAAQLQPVRLALIAVPLRSRIMQWLGAISYPVYLANEPIQKALAYALVCVVPGHPVTFDVVWLPAAIALPIGAAALLHRYVETPAHQWGRALARRSSSLGVTTAGARS
ncbi:MAG: acyltransferase [Acetobacteraceae bacterium]|jgi:peptidoglycan/LPS O-acetylase OafA/YrhL